MGKKKRWVRLKRAIQKLKQIQIEPSRGDAGVVSDTIVNVIGNKHQKDTSFVINDNAVIARPKQ